MRQLPFAATLLVIMGVIGFAGNASAPAQSLDGLNLQIHGYATQGFLYSTSNNWNTTNSTEGSAAWTEGVLNVTAQPMSKLRIGGQGRYYLLGNFGNQIVLDWASVDYKVNERFGLRVGKVKSPTGLLNETQDVDPGQLWVLLPQSTYPLASRNSSLAHYGGVAYGSANLGGSLGKVEYRAFGGERVIPSDDGFFQLIRDAGLIPHGVVGPTFGGQLIWHSPVQGLLVGGYASADILSGTLEVGPLQGTTHLLGLHPSSLFARYEHNRAMLACEYSRLAVHPTTEFSRMPPQVVFLDVRQMYAMASYKVANKLTGGLYFSTVIDRKAAFTPSRYQKDWAISSRYDFNPYLYLKLEQHVIDGTMRGYSTSNNPDGLKPNSRMTLLKLGVSF